MTLMTNEPLLPGEERALTEPEFAEIAGLRREDVHELMEYGLIGEGETRMNLAGALAMRQAVKLKNDFDLDLFATGLLAGYIRRIHDLQAALQHQQAHTRPAATAVYTEVSYTEVRVRTD